MTWCKLLYNHKELQLLGTLNGGQSFRWTHNTDTDEWTGIFCKTVWILRQKEDCLQYKVLGSKLNECNETGKKRNDSTCIKSDDEIFKKLLEKYFRLDVKLGDYYKEWAAKDEVFRSAGQQFYGIRMLDQEPVENVFSFICSQNNHISRISSMVEKLCTHYGDQICEHDGVKYYAFPEVEKLAEPKVESELRGLGFGYRAKFIQKAAAQILALGGKKWFHELQNMNYQSAKDELIKLHGIGPKVANCICLMSLSHLRAVPVDTHVHALAARHYLPHLRTRRVSSLTPALYTEIADHFRALFGDLAGWAHTVLFCADLKKFQNAENENDSNNTNTKKKRRKC